MGRQQAGHKNKHAKVNGGKIFGDALREISPIVNDYIQAQIKDLELPSDLEKKLLELPQKRQSKNILRPTLTYLTYKALGGQRTVEEVCPLLAISELNNYYCYLDNWILDNKNGVADNPEEVRKMTISSQIFRDLTQKVIEESPILGRQKREISERLAKTTMLCYEGQFKDLAMTIDTLSEYAGDDEFLKIYQEKSHLQSGFLYGLSGEIGAILAGETYDTVSLAMNLLGTGVHISNDLGDFAIFTNEDGSFKLYQDQMADIINGRLSFPSYHVLKYGNEKERNSLIKLIGNRHSTDGEKMEASRSIMTSGAFDQTRKKLLNCYYSIYKKTIKQLPACPERDALSSVGEAIRYNKYLKALKNIDVS
ncbi:polyprenyl synthetase family protein [Candidatus Pacearchaeota archaeon]|nr:polyprenyl synthetase family protein [Candidatus Pacearchaeota archaeon]